MLPSLQTLVLYIMKLKYNKTCYLADSLNMIENIADISQKTFESLEQYVQLPDGLTHCLTHCLTHWKWCE